MTEFLTTDRIRDAQKRRISADKGRGSGFGLICDRLEPKGVLLVFDKTAIELISWKNATFNSTPGVVAGADPRLVPWILGGWLEIIYQTPLNKRCTWIAPIGV